VIFARLHRREDLHGHVGEAQQVRVVGKWIHAAHCKSGGDSVSFRVAAWTAVPSLRSFFDALTPALNSEELPAAVRPERQRFAQALFAQLEQAAQRGARGVW